jgi:two-component system, OmpR family, sensor kinase
MGATHEPEEIDRAMRRMGDEATRMGTLVEDPLTLARLDDAAAAPHMPVDAGQLVRDAAADARATAPDRRIDARADGDVTVVGAADQLRQVLANLTRNALVHTPPGTAIELTAVRGGPDVRLEVRDHGPGLPTDDPALLFERFWRAEGGRERGKSGAGLGLAIVSAIVAAHGGEVTASNAHGGGASSVVRLAAA